ncbi:MAG: chemotaxis protein CheW [Caulobacterales bacterium]
MDDLLVEFLTETAENLEVIDTELVRFEQEPSDKATLNNIFRLVHTIKGTCGFLGLPRLEGVAHAGETLLGKFRDGALQVTPDAVTLVLQSIDRIKEILAGLETTGVEPVGDDKPLLDLLHAAADGKMAGPAPIAALPVVEADPAGPNGERWDRDMQRFLRPGEVSLADLEAAFMAATADEPAAQEVSAPAPSPSVARAPAKANRDGDGDEDDAAKGGRSDSTANQTIRVNVELLEQMMTMVSELVLTRNQLLQMVRGLNDSEFKAPLQRLSLITAELQERVMKTRMQPVGSAWRKLPRIVRDASRDLGKKIELREEGEATELDRQVLEYIKDPLTHMVRNSCDHGLERPADRVAAGKPEAGTIRLSAHHEGGHIIMEIADDGAGLNTARIRQKAIEKGIVSEAEAASMSDAQIHRFIFAPGFSTAAAVTNMSGRGVGMDVVRTNIEAIGGSIELSSQEGKGTTFRIKIPLTLAIVQALILGAAGQRFAAPQTAVVELVRVGRDAGHQVEIINNAPVMRLRDRMLPLVELSDVLDLPKAEIRPEVARFVAVMQIGATRFGVVVDEVHDTEEIVVKPLASLLRGAPMLSGATILGDGSVVLILDPNALSAKFGQNHKEHAAGADALAGKNAEDGLKSLILFRAGSETIKGVPLQLVTRLEQASVASLERADGRVLMQYRGALMPLTHMAGDYAFKTEGMQPVLVFTVGSQAFGVAVDEIVDIVREPMSIDLGADRPGILGVAVVRGQATEIIDVSHYLQQAAGEWQDHRGRVPGAKGRILVVEQSAFSRQLLTPLLEAAGYEAVEVQGFADALLLKDKGMIFDAVLADVDGDPNAATAFAERISEDPAWDNVVRLGLSGGVSSVQIFSDCVRKNDRAGLIAALEYAIQQKEHAA